ncbi:MAG: LuxR C-terminal-related transcriptional regulator [Planctomycetota bacterium]
MDKKTKILLADDHPLFRKGLRLLLEEEKDLHVVGEAADGQAAIEMARELSPDVAVMDITMPGLDGIEATRRIISNSPNTRIIALSIHSGKRFVENMLHAGAAGYLLKESVPEELVNGIRAVMRGEVCLSAAITGVVVSQFVKILSEAEASAGEAELTTREREVARSLTEGRSAKEIASVLKVGVKTVESTQRRIMRKLGANSVVELAEIARERLWLTSDDHTTIRETASHPILRTRLYRPPVPPDLVPRSQILKGLTNLDKRSLSLVSAPAGYGKSTLASSWLETCAYPYAWLSLDEDDNDLHVFLSYFLAAIQSMFPDVGKTTQILLNTLILPPLSVLTEALLNDLDQIDDGFILVLDDYHRIRETAVHDLLSELLSHPPQGLHLVLLTRRDPPLPLVALRSRGQMNEISYSQLRFSPAETAAFLQNALELSVDEATATLLDEKIEGWAAGLRLLVHSLSNRRDLDRLLAGLRGGFSSIMDYLMTEVLSRQPPEVADCLLKTAILDRFCLPLLDAVRGPDVKPGKGQIDGEEFIAWLKTNNLFLISLDAEDRWFRYHNLFQQLLQDQLMNRFGSEEIAALHSRASEWLEENDLLDEAIRHALAGGGDIGATQLVEQNRQAMLNSDRWRVFEKWLSMFPESVIQQRPGLLMARVWVLYHRFDIQTIPSVIDAVESLLNDAPIEQPLRGEIDFFRGYIHYFQNDGSSSLEYLHDALERVPETYHGIRDRIEIFHGLASQMQGQKEEVVSRLNDLLGHCQSPQSVRKTRLLVTLIYIHIIASELDEALVANQQLCDFATKGNHEYAKVWSSYLQGLIHFYKNDLQEAIDYFRRAIEHRYILPARATVDSMAGLVYAYQATQQPDRASDTMQLLLEYVGPFNDPVYSMIARSCQARLSIMQGELKPVIGRLRGTPPAVENMVWWLEIPAITYCRALLAEGSQASLEEAETRLQECLQLNKDNHNNRQMIEILALLATIHQNQKKTNKAQSVLKRAITLAQPGGFVRPFVELGALMVQLLRQLAKQQKNRDFVRQLQVAFRHEAVSSVDDASDSQAANEPPTGSEALPDPLSKREFEVLSLLAQGLSNKEIASETFLSPETIKKHVYNIYQKLHVHSRISAIEKARELGIIPRS